MQIGQWLTHAAAKFVGSDSPRLDADLLMCFVLDCNRTALYTWPEKVLTPTQSADLETLLQRRLQGEPVNYLTGQREFWSLDFEVNKDVLVPRSETELMVELALHALQTGCENPVLDAGTGSGVIAISLYLQWHDDHQDAKNGALNVIASDYSKPALAVAKRNAIKHGAEAIDFVHSDWLNEFSDHSIGMIVSNPPYLALSDPHMHNGSLDFEPATALVSGDDGLDAIRTIVEQACRVGVSGCYVLIEHGYEQALAVQTIMREMHYTQIETHQDMSDLDRVTCGYCPKIDYG